MKQIPLKIVNDSARIVGPYSNGVYRACSTVLYFYKGYKQLGWRFP